MRQFIKENYRFLLCVLSGIFCGMIVGFALYPRVMQTPENNVQTVDHIGRINILPDTLIHCTYRFTGCEHVIDRSIDPLVHVGQTKEEFLNEYRDTEIQSFSSERVQLRCLKQGPCPQHIMLRADETGQLSIYQTKEDTLEVTNIQILSIFVAAFPSEIAEELYEGIVFSSLDEINEYLENIES